MTIRSNPLSWLLRYPRLKPGVRALRRFRGFSRVLPKLSKPRRTDFSFFFGKSGDRLKPVLHVALLFLVLAISCSGARDTPGNTTLEFWALGREGEVVQQLIPEFERRNPGIKVNVQQIPWTAAHEKLLTAHVGESTPDLAQMGNTWVPEFHAVGALEQLDPWVARSQTLKKEHHFPGIWLTNIVDGQLYGIPWYVDTRLIFYRSDILADAGFKSPPRTWSEWMRAMQAVAARRGKGHWPILLPTNEWSQPVLLGLQQGAVLVKDGRWGAFQDPAFARAFGFYLEIFRRGFAPVVSNTQVANVYQQFGRGDFAMYITGPWNIGEFRRRLSPDLQDKWMTAPMPAPDGTSAYPGASLAGGASLVMFSKSNNKESAWKLLEFLSEPAQQVRFYELTGDLPARREAWDAPALAADPPIAAFRTQLENVLPTPQVPEWEQIATAVWEHVEAAARGQMTQQQALASLDKKTNQILEKRRWVLDRREQSR